MRAILRFLGRHPFVLVPSAVYFASASRHIGLPDSAIAVDAMRDAAFGSGACAHNLTTLTGFVFNALLPLENIAFKSNLVSVFFGSCAIILFYFLMLSSGLPGRAAALVSSALMVSHSMWWHSTMVESYALSAAFLIACLLVAAKDTADAAAGRIFPRRRFLLCFLAGLSLFNHVQNAALLPACAAFLIAGRGRKDAPGFVRTLVVCGGGWLLGALPYFGLLISDLARAGDTRAVLAWAVGGPFTALMFGGGGADSLKQMTGLLFLQWPSPFLFFALVGMLRPPARFRSGGLLAFLWTNLAINAVFVWGYRTWDRFSFGLPVFVCLAVFGGFGVAAILRAFPAGSRRSMVVRSVVLAALVLSAALPPFVYLNIGRWSRKKDGYWAAQYGDIGRQYARRYDMVGMLTDPVRHDRGTIESFVRALLEELPEEALFIDDVTTFHQIEHFRRYYGLRPDLKVAMLQPPGFPGWGTDAAELASEALARGDGERTFVLTADGRCGEFLDELAAFCTAREFPLSGGRRVYEIRPRSVR